MASFGPPIPGAPWTRLMPRPPASGADAGTPGQTGSTAAGGGGGGGRSANAGHDKPFVERVPNPADGQRLRRHTEKVSEVLNSLMAQGLLVQTAPGAWSLAGVAGATGPQGPAGATGATGATGPKGDPGTSSGVAAIYNPFTAGSNDDLFSDGTFSGWTAVNDGGSSLATVTEANNCASFLLPGGDTTSHLQAWVKAVTLSAGNFVEACFRGMGVAQNFNIAGVLMADGATYNSGAQQTCYQSVSENLYISSNHTGYNARSTNAQSVALPASAPIGDTFLRLVYLGSNTFRMYASPDGVSWVPLAASFTRTLTPTYAGFFVTTWGGASGFCWSFRYVRFG